MRLRPKLSSTLLATAGALLLAMPASAQDGPDPDDDLPPPPSAMMADDLPPPGYAYPGPGRPGWDHGHLPPPPGALPGCGHGGHHAPVLCGYAVPGYGHRYMGYGVPMIMVPVLRDKPCPERVVEEWVEEPVRVRRRYIPPRRAVPDKRVRIVPDKRLPMDKRIAY